MTDSPLAGRWTVKNSQNIADEVLRGITLEIERQTDGYVVKPSDGLVWTVAWTSADRRMLSGVVTRGGVSHNVSISEAGRAGGSRGLVALLALAGGRNVDDRQSTGTWEADEDAIHES